MTAESLIGAGSSISGPTGQSFRAIYHLLTKLRSAFKIGNKVAITRGGFRQDIHELQGQGGLD